MNNILRTLNHWRSGVRLYIAIAILVVTLETWWWASATYAGSDLMAIRLEEIYAWLSLAMISTAVFIGPTYKFFPNLPGKSIMFDARRLIGVGGGWFASLHVAISYNALFSLANPLTLPVKYQQAFAVGLVALIILFAMVGTSFDRAFNALGIWWFRLHRLVYVALLAIILHAFLIGAHATALPVVLLLLFGAINLLLFHILSQQGKPSRWKLATVGSVTVALFLIFNYGFTHKSDTSPANPPTKGAYTQ